MKKKKYIIAGLGLAVLCACLVYWNGIINVFFNSVGAYASTNNETINKYFTDAKYINTETAENGAVYRVYKAGDYEITTDKNGNKILAVINTSIDEVANKNIAILNSDEIEQLAVNELKKYIDIKYDIEIQNVDDRGNGITLDVVEKNEKFETGAKGRFWYTYDGILAGFSFSDRIIECPANEKIISMDEALEIAVNTILEDRNEICEINELIYDSKKAVELHTIDIGQVYVVKLSFNLDGMTVYCVCSIKANNGELIEMAYSDY